MSPDTLVYIPIVWFERLGRTTLDELLDVAGVATEHPRDRGIAASPFTQEPVELLSDMFHRLVPSFWIVGFFLDLRMLSY